MSEFKPFPERHVERKPEGLIMKGFKAGLGAALAVLLVGTVALILAEALALASLQG